MSTLFVIYFRTKFEIVLVSYTDDGTMELVS